ncbi:hypothetical protein F5Y01DRAFT_321140 [Xylaria sp. FL0043]|nr:hypothetical protein F5Y01DRAFT_321140 [Xylaria sp. FL0043]
MNVMGDIEKRDTKTANQAWRSKPRKWAPKSRLGCKTCKIRRVKCDLSQPSCLKCQSTGRSCDGYGEIPLTSAREVESSHYHNEKANRPKSNGNYHPCIALNAYQPKQWHVKDQSPMLQNLRPFMILPVIESAQTEAMSFFEYISIKHLNEYHPSEPWRKTLMFFSQTVPAVRYAAMALALIHRNHLDHGLSDRVHRLQSPKSWSPNKTPLLYYNRAIKLLLNQESGDSTETTAITLLVCYLFTCFDQLAGNYVQAIKHLRGGVELSRNIDKAILSNDDTCGDVKSSGIHTLISQVTGQIRRLDMQAVAFLTDWTPVDIQETIVSQIQPVDRAFQSLDQAADRLYILVARVMGLHYSGQQMSPTSETQPSPAFFKNIVLGELQTWSTLFENMLHQGSSYEKDSENYPLVSLLRLHHTIVWTLLSSYGPAREMEYDNFLPLFQQCVALADDMAAAHERYSGSLKPTFTPDIGIIPVLYIIGAKCRHPTLRRQILSILRRQPMREAVWDSVCAARVLERIIEIEEGGHEEGEMALSMDQIAVWQRVEIVSWVQVVSGQFAPRLDLTYTFCAQEEVHTESLML